MAQRCIIRTRRGRCPGLAMKTTDPDCGICAGQAQPAWPALATWRHRHYQCQRCWRRFAVSY